MKRIYLSVFLSLILVAKLNAQCSTFKADFKATVKGNDVDFKDQSTGNRHAWFWDFGDGNTASGHPSPNHSYTAIGTYTACLIARDTIKGCVDTVCKTVTIVHPCASFTAMFIPKYPVNLLGYKVDFLNTSSAKANKFSWDFGDGTFSNTKTVNHTYVRGTFNACLIATDTIYGCADTMCETIKVNPCDFKASFTVSATGPLEMYFKGYLSTYASKYYYDYGDGQTELGGAAGTAYRKHTYSSPGNYNVKYALFVDSGNFIPICNDTFYQTVTVSHPSCSTYKASYTSSGTNLTRSFTNTTAGSNNIYTWYFGGGATSNSANPNHTYSSGGSYTVCLVARDTVNYCYDSIVKNITVCGSGFANFTASQSRLSGYFKNPSTVYPGTTNTYYWTFGDGNSSTSSNPGYHTYSAPGTYTVCLKAYSTAGCADSICKTVTIVACSTLNANFTYTQSCQTVSFTNTTSPTNNWYKWSFMGNYGNDSRATNTTYTYTTAGVHSACLYARDTITQCDDSLCKTITIPANLRGSVYRDSGVIADSGQVYLIKMVIDTITPDTILTAVDSVMISGGLYSFNPVTPGNYLVKAALSPGSTYYSSRIPTYYGNVTGWRNASAKNVNTACATANITLVTGTNPGGSGFIGGYVSAGANKTGDPLERMQVVLYTAANVPLAYTYTNANGEYSFSNIAYGTYKVIVEITGKPCEEYIATLSQTNTEARNANFEVNTKNITLMKSSTGIAEIENGGLVLYPNPASAVVNVGFESVEGGEAVIIVTDLTGKEIRTVNYAINPGNNTITIDVSNFAHGLYVITLNNGGIKYTGKLYINDKQ